jgi:hypothetical protein
MLLYQIMAKRKLFKLRKDAHEFRPSFVPLNYIQTFFQNENDARQFWIAMMRTIRPGFNGETLRDGEKAAIDEALIQVFPADQKEAEFRALAARLNGVDRDYNEPLSYNEYGAKDTLLKGESEHLLTNRQQIVNESPRFKFFAYSADPKVNMLNQQAWDEAYVSKAKELFDQYLDKTDEQRVKFQEELLSRLMPSTKGAKKEHRKIVKAVYDDMLRRSFYASNENELGGLLLELKYSLADLSRQIRTKVNWLPVIIGVDGRPFFPKSIGMDMVTEAKVNTAKMEYLSSMDEETREVIKREMYDQIQLRWFDVDRGVLVEGFVH